MVPFINASSRPKRDASLKKTVPSNGNGNGTGLAFCIRPRRSKVPSYRTFRLNDGLGQLDVPEDFYLAAENNIL
jgi:hypothetical protein